MNTASWPKNANSSTASKWDNERFPFPPALSWPAPGPSEGQAASHHWVSLRSLLVFYRDIWFCFQTLTFEFQVLCSFQNRFFFFNFLLSLSFSITMFIWYSGLTSVDLGPNKVRWENQLKHIHGISSWSPLLVCWVQSFVLDSPKFWSPPCKGRPSI